MDLRKDVKVLYNENYKALLKETEEDTKKEKHILCSWIEGSTQLKCPGYPKQNTDLMHCPPKS